MSAPESIALRQMRQVQADAATWTKYRAINVDTPAGFFRLRSADLVKTANALFVYTLAVERNDKARRSRAMKTLAECPAEAFEFIFRVAPAVEDAFIRQDLERTLKADGTPAELPPFLLTRA